MIFPTKLLPKKLIATLVAIAVVVCGVFQTGLRAQEGPNDPNNIWYRAFLLVEAARKAEEEGGFLEALNKLTEAKPYYTTLEQNFPGFQTEIIQSRRKLNEEKRIELKEKMKSGSMPKGTPIAQPAPLGSPSQKVEITEPDGEFSLPSWNEGDGTSHALPYIGVGEIARNLTNEFSRQEGRIDEEVDRKNRHISKLLDENLALNEKLEETRREVDFAKRETARLKQAESQSNGADLERLRGLLKSALNQLDKVTNMNQALLADLSTSRAETKKLKAQVTSLKRERDNLLEVVSGKENGGKALKELMDRNAELIQQLDRAENLVASLSELKNQKDSDILLLQSEISKVKRERDQLIADNINHQKKIDQLLTQLQMLSDGLSAEDKLALNSASPLQRQENELLRSLVLKQLRRESQVKEAKKLLMRQLDKVGEKSEALLGIIADIGSGPQLSPEEKALFNSPQFAELIDSVSDESDPKNPAGEGDDPGTVSATLIAPGNNPGKTGVIREQKLSVELEQIDKAARLDFKEGRYAEAEAGYLRYSHFRPQSVSCLCNLGVLKIAMKNYSEAEHFLERAIAIDKTSGLGYYLLGRTYFLQERYDEALSKLEQGIKYDPRNAKAQHCMGVVSSKKGFVTRAEKAFVSAVSIDPNYGDAHFNLALLLVTRNEPNPKKAYIHYQKALDLGIPRSTEIEDFLNEAKAAGIILGMR